MTVVDVIIPVLGRPERVRPLLASLAASEREIQLRPVFVFNTDDEHEAEAVRAADTAWIPLAGGRRPGDYARKVNVAYRHTQGAWLFLGADDLHFHPGWAEAAIGRAEKLRKRVVGTNDLGNPQVKRGLHSTHTLVARSYVDELGTIDEPGKVLHEGYDHQFVDNEFVETARHRGEFVFVHAACVEHLHPNWGKARTDATYDLALAESRADRALFRHRRRLWRGGMPSHRRIRR